MRRIDITTAQRRAIYAALLPHACQFVSVGVYGSRVTGKARLGSDIDLIVYGTRDDYDFGIIQSAIIESDLSIFADVSRYEDISYPPLKREIDENTQILFSGRDFQPSPIE